MISKNREAQEMELMIQNKVGIFSKNVSFFECDWMNSEIVDVQ